MDRKTRKIMEKIEDLNSVRAACKHNLDSLEKKKKNYSEKKYSKLKQKYSKKIEIIKKEIRELENKLHGKI